jgi:hypothetical protein
VLSKECSRMFLECRIVNAWNVSLGLQLALWHGKRFVDLFQSPFRAGVVGRFCQCCCSCFWLLDSGDSK